MVEMDLNFIHEMYNKFKGTNEENIKNHVVVNFLKILGYDPTDFNYEQPKIYKDGRADIAVRVNDSSYLFVEIKNSENKLTEKEQSQLADYLFGHGYEWGILTNGRNYVLINVKIEGKNLDRIIFNIDIFNKKDRDFIKYFRKENIFDVPLINYFKDVAQFKSIKYPNGGSSWNNYKGTLYGFFKYYTSNLTRYRDLSLIRVEEFEDYLKHEVQLKNSMDSGKKIISIETYDNKYSHIRSFFQTLGIKSNGFDEEKVQLIKRMNVKKQVTEINEMLTEENINQILNFYDSRRDSTRNKVIFLLCLSFGLERSTLLSLTTDSIKKDKLIIGNRELVLPPALIVLLQELLIQNKQNKVKGNSLFYSKYSNKFKPLSESTINYIFDILADIDKENPNWKVLNSSYIRAYLIKNLFKNNYSLEEIVNLIGADLLSISNVISYDEILEQVLTRGKKFTKKHPFHLFLH